MKRITKRQSQWIWFVGLWCGGFAAVLLLARLIRLSEFEEAVERVLAGLEKKNRCKKNSPRW